MIAHKIYHCDCGCGHVINPGDEFQIRDGNFYLAGHEPENELQSSVPAAPVEALSRELKKGKSKNDNTEIQLSLF